MEVSGLEDMLDELHKCICPWNQDKGMWSMLDMGREVRSRTDYILETDRHLLRNMSVRDPRHNLYHYLILRCLSSSNLREYEN